MTIKSIIYFQLGVIIFGSVRFLSKQVTKPNFFLKKKTETEPKPGQTARFRFGFLGQKLIKTGLAQFFRFWLGFFRFWLGFFGLTQFFRFGSVFF
jgi:hypothetical protein